MLHSGFTGNSKSFSLARIFAKPQPQIECRSHVIGKTARAADAQGRVQLQAHHPFGAFERPVADVVPLLSGLRPGNRYVACWANA